MEQPITNPFKNEKNVLENIPITKETSELASLLKQKTTNFYNFLNDHLDIIDPEVLRRKTQFGKGFDEVVASELLVIVPIIVTKLKEFYDWNFSKVTEMMNEIEESNEFKKAEELKDHLIDFLKTKMGKDYPDPKKVLKLKDWVNKDDKEYKKFLRKVTRYYQFFAEVILVLVPEAIEKA